MSDALKAWPEIERQTLLDCRVFNVERSLTTSPHDGSRHEFFRIRSPDWVQIVPVTTAGDIVMVRQYRHGPQYMSLEIPAGMVDAGEEPVEAAARECLEETGYQVNNVESLGTMNPNPALFSARLHSYCAFDAERIAEIQNTVTERTEVALVSPADLPDMLRNNEIDHALDAMTLWRFLFERECC